MKSIFRNILLASVTVLAFACNESEDLVTADAKEGGLVQPTSTSVFYVVGNTGPYMIEFWVNQRSDIYVESIDVYKTFNGSEVLTASDGSDSLVAYGTNEVLERSITVSERENHFVSSEFMYDELIADLTIDGGGALPTSDGDLVIGDNWVLRFEFNLSDGRVIQPNYTIQFTVSTRYAGTYAVLDKDYFRIGVDRSDLDGFWPATMDVTSVDAITYLIPDMWGQNLFPDQNLYMQIDPATNEITYPKEFAGAEQVLNDQPIITCNEDPLDMTNVPCSTSNVAIQMPDGDDILDMAYGYFTAGSGAREFYQRLQKII